MDSEKIAARLVELRGKKSRKEVASAIGVSLSALTMYENGERIPRDETKKAIASYYQVPIEAIFYS